MSVLVTGATGLVGNNVVRLLLNRGKAVRVLHRGAPDARPLTGLDVEIIPGDVRDADAVRRACEGATCVIHAAARVHIGYTGLDEQRIVNVEGTRNVAEACLASGARLVQVSTVDTMGSGSRAAPADEDTPVDGHVLCPYVITKREAERVVLDLVERGLNAVIVNPAFMLGPWDWKPSSGRMLLAVARGKGRFAPPGGNDFCDVREVAAGILAAAEKGAVGRRYILGGESLSYLESWRMFAQVTGGPRPIKRIRWWLVTLSGAVGSLYGRLSGTEPDVNSAAAAISTLNRHFSCQRAIQELGYQAPPARQAAEAAWAWFKEYGYC
jgi:dihydroflavonol-4-reductase